MKLLSTDIPIELSPLFLLKSLQVCNPQISPGLSIPVLLNIFSNQPSKILRNRQEKGYWLHSLHTYPSLIAMLSIILVPVYLVVSNTLLCYCDDADCLRIFLANSTEFLEARRKSLRRFLNIVGRHPIIAEDRLGVLKFFLTFSGSVSVGNTITIYH